MSAEIRGVCGKLGGCGMSISLSPCRSGVVLVPARVREVRTNLIQ